MAKRKLAAATVEMDGDDNVATQFSTAILNFLSNIPETAHHQSADPKVAAHGIANRAATKAAFAAGTLALPPGPVGWLTILPELVAVWKIQARMVADIAGVFGKTAYLTREQMLYCLFKHMAAQAMRDIAVQVGERILIKRVSLRALQNIAKRIGIRVAQRQVGKLIGRWLPIVGALGVAGYVYYDTHQVAAITIDLFASDLANEPGERATDSALRPTDLPVAIRPKRRDPSRRLIKRNPLL